MKNPLYSVVTAIRNELPANTKVVVGCSGGKDSKTLTGVLTDAGMSVFVVHIDHGLRDESAKEQKELSEWAFSLGLPFIGKSVNLSSSAEGPARQARRQALLDAATAVGAKYVALGHTARDQLETLLMRVARGTGLTGLACMRRISHQQGKILYRPLLGVKQKDIHNYLHLKKWTPIEDPSNQSESYTRNRFRHNVLPHFEKENGRVEEAITRLTRSLQEDSDALNYYTENAWDAFKHSNYSTKYLVNGVPRSIARRIIIRFWDENKNKYSKQLTSIHIDAVLHIAGTNKGTACLPGLNVFVKNNSLNIVQPSERSAYAY